ncbi:MAG: (deoxy)nucleoside triphosphate pyrophosphohydrolase [Haliangiales bacterium]
MDTRKLVAAALITAAPGQVLITQRRADQPLPLKWELPGGKIEPGESPEAALARELDEELGVEVEDVHIWAVLHHRYERYEVIMLVYRCQLARGQEVRCREVADFAWCAPNALSGYDLLAADRPLIDRLVAEGVPGFEPG